jgi:8-oxo-dGTP pyrophosphatase MutT (NUDIX family)
MIRRRRGGQVYWSFPGGGIKRGETPHRAARREVAEELGLDVRPDRLLVVASGHALFLATIDSEPPLRMRGPEVARRSRRDRYRPEWLTLEQITRLDVRPRRARVALVPLARAMHPAKPATERPVVLEPGEAPIPEVRDVPVTAVGVDVAIVQPDTVIVLPDAPAAVELDLPVIVEPDVPVFVEPDLPVVVEPDVPVIVAEPDLPVIVEPDVPVIVVEPDLPVVEPDLTVVEPDLTDVEPDLPVVEPDLTDVAAVVRPAGHPTSRRPGRWAVAWRRWRGRTTRAGRRHAEPPSARPRT